MAIKKISDVSTSTLKSGAYVVVSQPETVNGSEVEAIRRVPWSNIKQDAIADLSNSISQLDGVVNGTTSGETQDVTSSVEWTSGGSVVYSSGTINTNNTNYSYADIPLGTATHVAGYTRAGMEVDKGLAFLDSNGNYVSGDYNAGASSYDWNYSLDVPNGAATLRISCATSKLSNFTCILTLGASDGLVDRVAALEEAGSATALTELTDVALDSPSSGQALVYDPTTQKWINGDVSITVDSALSGSSTNPVQNSAIYTALASKASASDLATLDATVNGSGSSYTQDVTDSVEWTSGGSVIYSDGTINTQNTNYSYADIPLSTATRVSGYTRAGMESDKGLAFLDSNGNYISGDYHAGVSSYDWNYSFEIPSGAATLRISCATSKLANFTCTLTFEASGGLVARVEALENAGSAASLTELTDTTISSPTDGQVLKYDSSTSKWVNGTAEGSSASFGDLTVNWVDGYYVNAYTLGSTATPAAALTASDTQSIAFVDISAYAGGTISGHTRLNDSTCLAFFDSHGMFISGETLPSGVAYEWDFTDISVPASAKTVAISCKTSSKSSFTISGGGLLTGTVTRALEYDPPVCYGLDNTKSDFHYDSTTRLNDMYTWFDILTATFPRNMTRVQIGTSTTPEGTYAAVDDSTYPIYAYVIQGDYYVSGNDFIIASGIHGDETVGDGIQSVVSVAYFVKDLLCNPQKNKYLSFMKWNCRILVVPVMNPWGYQNGYRCNGRGVDCNRNFDCNFDPEYESYGYSSGTAAFSENESSAVATYISENFADAKYCTELHTRGGDVLSDDERWFTKVTDTNTVMQDAVTVVGYYMRRMYAGTVANGTQVSTELPPTFRAYVDSILNIPTNLVECAKSENSDITTFNADLVQMQYVQYLGAMTQVLVETYVM